MTAFQPPIDDPTLGHEFDERMLCSSCGCEIEGTAVMSPTLDTSKRQLCMDCADELHDLNGA